MCFFDCFVTNAIGNIFQTQWWEEREAEFPFNACHVIIFTRAVFCNPFAYATATHWVESLPAFVTLKEPFFHSVGFSRLATEVTLHFLKQTFCKWGLWTLVPWVKVCSTSTEEANHGHWPHSNLLSPPVALPATEVSPRLCVTPAFWLLTCALRDTVWGNGLSEAQWNAATYPKNSKDRRWAPKLWSASIKTPICLSRWRALCSPSVVFGIWGF